MVQLAAGVAPTEGVAGVMRAMRAVTDRDDPAAAILTQLRSVAAWVLHHRPVLAAIAMKSM